MCKETAYLVIDVKPDVMKSNGMPDLRKVPQMLAAGWGGVGTAHVDESSIDYLDKPAFLRSASAPDSQTLFSKASALRETEMIRAETTPKQFVVWCKEYFVCFWFTRKLTVKSLDELLTANLPDKVLEILYGAKVLSTDEQAEQQVIIAFFNTLLSSIVGQYFTGKQQQAITRAYQKMPLSSDIQEYLAREFEDLNEEWWGFSVEWIEDDE